MMVDFPEPDGAEKMMSFPFFLMMLEYIKHLLLDLLKVVFHVHHNLLELGLVGLAAHGVDFSSYFLADKSQFLALPLAAAHGVEEIVKMVLQAQLLFGDVEFLDIENEFLLKAVLVIVNPLELGERIENAAFDFLDA